MVGSTKEMSTGEERREVAEIEVKRLHKSGFIWEVKYTTWLSNVVLVKKSGILWQMYTDFTDFNKAYPKYAYSFPSG